MIAEEAQQVGGVAGKTAIKNAKRKGRRVRVPLHFTLTVARMRPAQGRGLAKRDHATDGCTDDDAANVAARRRADDKAIHDLWHDIKYSTRGHGFCKFAYTRIGAAQKSC